MNNPLKYTDPTGYQTAAVPGAVSWLGGAGRWGESGLGFGGNVNWDYFVPNTSYYKYYGNYDYTTYNWSTESYEHHTVSGVEEVSFDNVFDNFILPNGADITYLVKKSIKLGKKGIDIPFIYKDSFGSTGYGVGDKWVSWQKLVTGANTGNGGSAGGDKGAERESQTNIEFKVNNAIDNTVTLTSGSVYGAQKMAGIAARDMTRLTTLTVIGRVTGGLSIYYNSRLYFQNPKQNWWNGVEAAGQFAAIVIGYATGIEEVELVYNLTTFTIDMGRMSMEKYKQEHP